MKMCFIRRTDGELFPDEPVERIGDAMWNGPYPEPQITSVIERLKKATPEDTPAQIYVQKLDLVTLHEGALVGDDFPTVPAE